MSKQNLAKLKKLWYKKLKDSGFKDLEDTMPEPALKTWDSFYFNARYTPDEFAAKQRYFELATSLLQSYEFRSARDRKVWEMHADGAKQADIAKACKISQSNVSSIVTRIAKDSGICT